jgi:hypothetical protein
MGSLAVDRIRLEYQFMAEWARTRLSELAHSEVCAVLRELQTNDEAPILTALTGMPGQRVVKQRVRVRETKDMYVLAESLWPNNKYCGRVPTWVWQDKLGMAACPTKDELRARFGYDAIFTRGEPPPPELSADEPLDTAQTKGAAPKKRPIKKAQRDSAQMTINELVERNLRKAAGRS